MAAIPTLVSTDPSASQPKHPDGYRPEELLADYRLCCLSREASLLSRKEVLTGKAKFAISGEGKEVPQVVLARFWQPGDWRAGYYRDQTLLMALGKLTVEEFFAQLYADAENDTHTGGRQMVAHFSTELKRTTTGGPAEVDSFNSSSDVSTTGGQCARGMGLALASKKFREMPADWTAEHSRNGREVCFSTIGDASTSEGAFWESINAAAVLQVPLAVVVWDDGYGISVPRDYQTAKGSISQALSGMAGEVGERGLAIRTVNGYDYPALYKAFAEELPTVRRNHRPVLFHIENLTQPQGHSTSGSHERYKGKKRLSWEAEHDCILQFRNWLIEAGHADEEQLDLLQQEAITEARAARDTAWAAFRSSVDRGMREVNQLFERVFADAGAAAEPALVALHESFRALRDPEDHELIATVRRLRTKLQLFGHQPPAQECLAWLQEHFDAADRDYHSHLYATGEQSPLQVKACAPVPSGKKVPGHKVLNAFFNQAFENNPRLLAFGEDVGKIGGVNQSFAGLQKKYGEERVFDTGIREWTIMGQAIGLAMRGWRPIAEIQYLDYLLYGISPLSDDLATLRWRSDGLQSAPVIVRTRGHRLEGVWHSGSPLGMIVNALRGMHVCVPRDMTRAAGMYNTLLRGDDPALVIECLNGYRLREELPANLAEFTVPLGIPETLRAGDDLTLVTYGSCVRIALKAVRRLSELGVEVELIDAQTLLPFDREGLVARSLERTNRLLIVDEDVPGGASAYLLREITEVQGGFHHLDIAPRTLTAKAHRPPYGSRGDYFSKPSVEDIVELVLEMVVE